MTSSVGPAATVRSVPPDAPDDLPSRGDATKQRIVEAALRLFEERGYERTTMRAVATEAGVSLGSAYYYFDSKEHLVQGFYDRMQLLHREEAEVRLAGRGRVLLRPSGTEPVIRVMVEGQDRTEVRQFAEQIAGAVSRAASA